MERSHQLCLGEQYSPNIYLNLYLKFNASYASIYQLLYSRPGWHFVWGFPFHSPNNLILYSWGQIYWAMYFIYSFFSFKSSAILNDNINTYFPSNGILWGGGAWWK